MAVNPKRALECKIWREQNKAHVLQYNKAYNNKRRENKEYREWQIQYAKKYYAERKEEFAIHNREYREKNKEQISTQRKETYVKNKLKYVMRSRKNREFYRDIINQRQRDAQKRDPLRWTAYRISRRALGKIKKSDLQRLYEDNIKLYGTLTCVLCDKPIEFGNDSVEHILPINRGGTNDFSNLAIAHFNCNASKSDKTMEEWKEFRATIKAE